MTSNCHVRCLPTAATLPGAAAACWEAAQPRGAHFRDANCELGWLLTPHTFSKSAAAAAGQQQQQQHQPLLPCLPVGCPASAWLCFNTSLGRLHRYTPTLLSSDTMHVSCPLISPPRCIRSSAIASPDVKADDTAEVRCAYTSLLTRLGRHTLARVALDGCRRQWIELQANSVTAGNSA